MRLPLSTRRSGATLIEIVVVIAIILIMSTLSFTAFWTAKSFGDRIEDDTARAIAMVSRSPANRFNPVVPTDPRSQPPGTRGPSTQPRPYVAHPDLVSGHYYVGFNSSVANPQQEAQRLANLVGGRVRHVYTPMASACALECPDAKIALVRGDPSVQEVFQAHYVYPCASAPRNIQRVFSNQVNGAGNVPGGAVPTALYRITQNLHASVTTGRFPIIQSAAQMTTVAILDTGVTHPDLFVVDAKDFTGSGTADDTDGHGTHVAGVVGALNRLSSGGVIGVYPGAPIVSLKVFSGTPFVFLPGATNGAGGPTPTDNQLQLTPPPPPPYPQNISLDVVAGLNYVTQQARFIRICLMPFEMLSVDVPTNRAVALAANSGVIMVAAAGGNPESLTGGSPYKPTGVDLRTNPRSPQSASGVIVVGAMIDLDGQPGNLNKPVDAGAAVAAIKVNAANYSLGPVANNDDFYAPYSNYTTDPNVPFLAAPGGWVGTITFPTPASFSITTTGTYPQIRSTIPSASGAPQYSFYVNNQSVDTLTNANRPACGSSFAAAHVAGMLAYAMDPQAVVGFNVGGRGIPSLAPAITNHVTAFNALRLITHYPYSFQTGWQQVMGPFGPQLVRANTTFFNDVVTTQGGNSVPVANFYTNALPINYP